MKIPELTRVIRLGRNQEPESPAFTRLRHLSPASSLDPPVAPQLMIPSQSKSLLTQGPALAPSWLHDVHQTSELEQLLSTGVTTIRTLTAARDGETLSQTSIS